MTKLRNLGRKAGHAVTGIIRLITWPLRRFALLVSPLYPVLKWFAGVALVGLVINLVSAYMADNSSLPSLKAPAEFITAHRNPTLLAIGGVLVLFYLARVGHMWKERQRRLQAAFGLFKSAEDLRLADLGFRESRPDDPERGETHREERPFFGTYFPRTAVEDTESTDADADAGVIREFAEEDLEQLLRQGRGFLLVDHLYSGKTGTVFEILRRLKGYTILMPDDSRPVPDQGIFALLRGRKVVVLLDNLATLAQSNYNLELFVRRIAEGTSRLIPK